MEIVKYIVTLWSHHKQSESQLLLGVSILYTVEICLIDPSQTQKGVIANQNHICDFVMIITLSSQLHMITEVDRMPRNAKEV